MFNGVIICVLGDSIVDVSLTLSTNKGISNALEIKYRVSGASNELLLSSFMTT